MNEHIISINELKDLMKNQQEVQLVDVRTAEKHEAYHIGGQLIPMAELVSRFHELDANKLVVTYCTSGGNSMRALQFLYSVGFKSVKSLDGGMNAWRAEEEKLT
jgi:adenylyltransferase/sulfurtransferase